MKVNRLLVAGVIVVFVTQLYFIDKITNGVRQLKGDPVIINGGDNYKNCGNAPAVHAPTSSVDGHISATPRALNDMVKYYAKNYTWTVVIGIPTIADKREARMRIRSTYLTHYPQTYCPHCEHPHPAPEVLVLFFIGKQSNAAASAVAVEQQMYGDLVELDVSENMNKGKTYHLLEWTHRHLRTKFVMKADDDSFIVIANLVQKLHFFEQRIAQPGNIYYGFPCYLQPDKKIEDDFMCGMGYVLGRDVLAWIATNNYPREAKAISNEDIATGLWMGRYPDVVRIGNRLQFHEPPTHKPSRVAFEYNCADILVHPLKTLPFWTQASLFYLNCCAATATAGPAYPFCTHQAVSETTCSKGRGVVCYPETVEPLGQFDDTARYFDDARYAKHALYAEYFDA